MRNLLLILVAVLAACSTAKPLVETAVSAKSVPKMDIILTGRLLNAHAGDSVWVARKGVKRPEVVLLDATGKFRLVLQGVVAPIDGQLNGPSNCSMIVFLQPGDSVNVTAECRDFYKTVDFTGRGSFVNNYLAQAHRHFDNSRDSVPERLYTKDLPAEYKRKVDLRRQQQLEYMNAYAAQQPLPTEFIRIHKQVLDIQRAVSLLSYMHYAKYTTKQEPALPADFLASFTALPLSSLSHNSDLSIRLATSHLFEEYQYARLLPPNGILPVDLNAAEQIFAQATADFGDTPARDQVIGRMLCDQLRGPLVDNPQPVLAMLPLFKAHNRDSVVASTIRQALRSTEHLRRGDLAPVFTLQDASGKRVSLQDFRGKVVYLDFWYSSCAPCLAEAPAAVKLKKQFMGRDVVFLYISIDRKADDWQKALARHPLTSPNSVHLLDPGGYKASANYGVGGFPSYWIIGRDGRIRQGAAPRPSAGAETVAVLEQALAQRP
ncbi:TlpA disulfide reductase family protein [Hymenobacter sp. GOD-10R]|uniref:TlpA family protein disulfide reductase n=1 Tax=Hymenobacter sp. GOD-10R TaxID=3093922 RepID=UPI002D785240|nr:TlpA disulfide reductase family protein [Hymenobacter sp. GOD-10R]WRQ26460.1 TlpA disulfide reductase family protein [Hymenobacter sp. GOD-10R]